MISLPGDAGKHDLRAAGQALHAMRDDRADAEDEIELREQLVCGHARAVARRAEIVQGRLIEPMVLVNFVLAEVVRRASSPTPPASSGGACRAPGGTRCDRRRCRRRAAPRAPAAGSAAVGVPRVPSSIRTRTDFALFAASRSRGAPIGFAKPSANTRRSSTEPNDCGEKTPIKFASGTSTGWICSYPG